MKTIITLVFFGLALTQFSANAQSLSIEEVENSIKPDGKYAILASNRRIFESSVRNGENFRTKFPDSEFQIVVVGPIVKELAEDESLIPFVEKCKTNGVKIVLCQAAMAHLGVKKEDLHPYIQTTIGAYQYMFGLQENGFRTLMP
ncbi:DsrE/DsrF/DrsH-like family protein [Jiulongibacter sediminis]|jgi:intracellular sulfur oxidation DsrE/DsrF family protein|uniref:DsrE/DsrF/DrsH-like family protein n=1 Tax=Jiulongibacter sediminis TaxID=1605367 RepID=UPI0026E93873|nr:DsrE/DsrF/DrsH-like family protein [Jiulongibacter sediminis]